MLLHFATELCASVSQYSQHWQTMRFIKWQYTIIQQISGCNRCFSHVKLAVSHTGVRIDEGMQLSSAEPEVWGRTYEEMYLDFCKKFTGRVMLENGLQGCIMDRAPGMPEKDEYGTYQINQSPF